MKNNKGMILSTYVYMLLVFFLLLLGTMLVVLNNTKLLADKLKENAKDNPAINKDLVSLVLNGDDEMVIIKGDTFIDPGYIAKTQSGKTLTAKVEGNVDTSTIGEYIITYTIKYKQFSKTATRKVYVTGASTKDYIENLYNDDEARTKNGLKKDNTSDKNIRYEGSNPNNYVKFNDELWRVIGVFGDNIKLIRSESIGKLSWDSSASNIYSGYGINEWSASDLKEYLNTMYYGGSTVTCYGGRNNATTTCPTASLSETAKSMIDNHIWNTGAINYKKDTTIMNQQTFQLNTVPVYNAERGNESGKVCSSSSYCVDTVPRTTKWQGYVALPYATDWAYASSEVACKTDIHAGYDVTNDSADNMTCKKNNWMHYDSTATDGMWTISAYAPTDGAYVVWLVYGNGFVSHSNAAGPAYVFPTTYLKSDVKITSGSGTSADPYILSTS